MYKTNLITLNGETWVVLKLDDWEVARMPLKMWRGLAVNQNTDEEQTPYDVGPART